MARSVAEILESYGRAGHDFRPYIQSELDSLRAEWKGIGIAGLPFIEFLPIKLVSLVEKQIRYSLAEAIDYGNPYSSRAFDLVSNWPNRNIFEAFQATASRKITLGRLVSYSFNLGRVNELIATLGKVFGGDIKHQLSTITTLWSEDEPASRVPIITDIEEALNVLDRLFRLRHILVHESSSPHIVTVEDIDHFFYHASQLIKALNWLLISQTVGHMPATQASVDIKGIVELVKTIHELDRRRGGSREDFKNPNTHSQWIEHHWDEFCRLSAEKAAGFDIGDIPGSMAPLLYSSELESLTRWRLDRLAGLRSSDEVDF